jgi:zinc/manganese transport system substrate-binding protein
VGARNAAIQTGARGYLDCSQFVQPLDVALRPVDRSMGDIHPAGNPHYLTDPRAAVAVASGIVGRLVELDPAHAAAYQRQLAAFVQRLELARKRWEAALAPQRGTPIIEYHKTLSYLASWLGLQVVGAVEPKPGLPPNPSHVAQLLARARIQKVRAIVQEEYYPDATSRLLADKIPAALIRIPGGANFQAGQDYLHYLDEVIRRIAAGLSAKGRG